jgi:hypothetical protein
MLGKITAILENTVEVTLSGDLTRVKNLLNYHVIFEENNYKIVGEIKEVNANKVVVNLLGEISNNTFLAGVIRKPSLDSVCRIIQKQESKRKTNFG